MSKDQQRRTLRFSSIDEALGEAERLVAAEREGRLACVGNWKLGQALGHLATWANFAQDGYPPEVRAPLPVRMILRLMRGTVLNKGMMPGVRVGKIPGGTLGLEPMDADEGMRRFREMATETAGFYNTVGFNDDTRAFPSIPARHDVARRVDCAFLARLVTEHRLGLDEAHEVARDLAYALVKRAYKL